jgi:DNA-binding CsgD family transcriptional regulator
MARLGNKLTRRECDVVQAILAGHTSNELIAARLGLSVRTVGTFLNSIYAKVGARDRAHLVLLMSERIHVQPVIAPSNVTERALAATADVLWTVLDESELQRLMELLTVRIDSPKGKHDIHGI